MFSRCHILWIVINSIDICLHGPGIYAENHVKAVRHYSVHKREARKFHGSGLISNHANFACDVEVSTIATTKAREEYKLEALFKYESGVLHRIHGIFGVNYNHLSCQLHCLKGATIWMLRARTMSSTNCLHWPIWSCFQWCSVISWQNTLVTIKAQFTSDEWDSRNIAHYTSGSTRASRFNVAGDFTLACLFAFLEYPWAERETARSLQGNAVLFHSTIYNLEQKNSEGTRYAAKCLSSELLILGTL